MTRADPIERQPLTRLGGGDTIVDPNKTGGRHRRRRDNSVARATLDEARRAGLVQRHLRKLRYLTARSVTSPPDTDPGPLTPGTPPHTTESGRAALAGLETTGNGIRPQPVDLPRSSNAETAA
jgi:hypothetical protein